MTEMDACKPAVLICIDKRAERSVLVLRSSTSGQDKLPAAWGRPHQSCFTMRRQLQVREYITQAAAEQ